MAAQAPEPSSVPGPAPQAAGETLGEITGIGSYAGLRVREIRFVGIDPVQQARIAKKIVQPVGQPLSRNLIRESIQNLYTTGRYANLLVEGERTPENEVVLTITLEQNYFMGRVSVDGIPKHGPSFNQLVNATRLDLGEMYQPDKMTEAITGIQRVLREAGFYETSVTFDQTRHPDTFQMDVLFHIHSGPRARIGEVSFVGKPGISEPELIRISQIHPGEEVTSGKAQRGLERLRKHYNKGDRLEAEVVLSRSSYHTENNTVDYEFSLTQGPVVDIGVRGTPITRPTIKKLVPVYEENAVDEDLLNEGSRNLRDYMQTKGYFDARVAVHPDPPQADPRRIEYVIDRGERHKLVEVDVQGNKYFPTDLIRERMLLQSAGWLLSHGRYSAAMLSRDIGTIADLYHANGFAEVKVGADVQDDYQGETGRMRVVILIDEGTQTLVRTLRITGNESVSEADLLGLLDTGEGQPYSDYNLASDRDSILNYYFNHGFPEVTFEANATPAPDNPHRMDVTYTLHEGQPVSIDHVIVSGLHYTKPYIVDRELQVHDGAPLSQAEMLETQRRLYDLGIFNAVDIAVQNPDGEAREKNLLVSLSEAKRWTFDYGFGIEVQTGSDPGKSTPQGRTGVSPRVSFDATRINFLGRDHTLLFKARVGRLQQRGLFSYEAPHWYGHENLKLSFTAFYDDTADVRTFTAQRLEGSVQLEQKVSKVSTLLYRFAYRKVKVDPRSLVISPALIPLFSQPVRIGIPSVTYLRDKRDDVLDSHKGTYTTIDLGVASSIFGSQSNFARILLLNSSYHSFKKGQWVFARSTRIGVEQPYGTGLERLIPLPELFFAGGSNSHRGFAINQAGPRDPDTGFPLGGQAMFVNNFELRTPPIPLPYLDDNVSAVFFHDMGNVFARPSDMFPSLFRTEQPNVQNCQLLTVTAHCSFAYTSHAIGAGVRYKTPIGPVRFDVGYNLNPPTFPIRSEMRTDTLTHINFYFSIGQTF